jgi:cleavage and polyadenylation specificity factor subunit 3
MSRLKAALLREYEHDTENKIQIYNPRNTASVEFHFKGEKSAKVKFLKAKQTSSKLF